MQIPPTFDILIVGSGPSGVHAAVEATSRGLKVGMVDIGYYDTRYADRVPPKPFRQIRVSDPNQSEYFLGEPHEALRNLRRAGAHLTPPRQYMLRNMDGLFPLRSETFVPLQATSMGGLGVSWGANVFTFDDLELHRIGLPAEDIRRYYDMVAADIGVSGGSDQVSSQIADLRSLQQPLRLDSNALTILRNYTRARATLNRRGFFLGQSVLATLSEKLGDRSPNPLTDMDFYSDTGQSVYRPQFTLKSLKKLPNFTYLDQRLATSFEDLPGYGVKLLGQDLRSGSAWLIFTRRLLLAAGAINSGRLALNSMPGQTKRLGLLCNPNIWIAAINLSMLGRPAEDARYSLAQLTALLRLTGSIDDCAVAQFYSYRSLLHFRLLPDLPLPPRLGLLFLRLIETALTCINVHFADIPAESKWIESGASRDQATLSAHYELTPAQMAAVRRAERATLRCLQSLRCITMAITRPAHGASIHYAGTLPFSDVEEPFTSDRNGRLHGTRHVYVADGSTWRFLPAKGLTFTLMANARRVAKEAALSLKA